MIKHIIEDNSKPITYIETVNISKKEKETIEKLLSLKNLDELSEEELNKYGAKQDDFRHVYSVGFEDGSALDWRLLSGDLSYYDDVIFTHPDNIYVDLDCTFELDDIEIESGNKIYIVKLNIVDDKTTWNKNEILWKLLMNHRGHNVEIASYGDWDNPDDICLECTDCNEVILDAEIYTICAREDER